MKKKNVLLAIVGVALCAAIVLTIVLTSGIIGQSTEPTGNNGTVDTGAATEGTGNSGDTKPSDGTEATDGADPSGEATDPSEDATQPSENTTEPSGDATEPAPTEPDPTEPAPTEPPVTEPAPTEPAPTEPVPTNPPATEPPAPTNPPAPTENVNDFGGLTPMTITSDVYWSWSWQKQTAFDETYPESEMTPEERHNYRKAVYYGGYTCTEHDDHCINEQAHNLLLEQLATPCRYCGQTNCPSYMHINPDTLYFEEVQCENYDIYKDPCEYCQTCGKPAVGDNPTEQCTMYLGDTNCIYCGVWVEGWTCHTCKQEDIDNYNGG